MKVREVLTPLVKTALTRLCRRRDLPARGTKGELLRRLAYSYHGDLSALVLDLRRQDLLAIEYEYRKQVEFPAGLGALPVAELRKVCLAVFEERYRAPTEPAGRAAKDGGKEKRRSEAPDGRDFDIVLHATGCGGGPEARHVDLNSLAGMAKDADSVTILSAYYVPDVLKTIAGACRGDVRVVLNGLGGRRLDKQAAELGKLQAALGTERRLARHCRAFVDSEVPEIWEDNVASASFADSFFDSLAYASSAWQRPRTAKRILDSLKLSRVTAEEVRAALEGALEEEGWYEANFGSAGG